MRHVALLLLTLRAWGASAPCAWGQEYEVRPRLNGEIRGRVIELDTGRVIKFAVVQLKGTPVQTMTGVDGSFTIEDIPPGVYTLEIWGLSCRPIEVQGVSVAWTQITRIAMPLALPRHDPLRQGPLIFQFGDVENVARMLKGTLPPRLAAEEKFVRDHPPIIVAEPLIARFARVEFEDPFVRRLPVTWDEFRDMHMWNSRLERNSVTWTEAWRNRLE